MNIPDFWGEYLREKRRVKNLGVVQYDKERFDKQNRMLINMGLQEPPETQKIINLRPETTLIDELGNHG